MQMTNKMFLHVRFCEMEPIGDSWVQIPLLLLDLNLVKINHGSKLTDSVAWFYLFLKKQKLREYSVNSLGNSIFWHIKRKKEKKEGGLGIEKNSRKNKERGMTLPTKCLLTISPVWDRASFSLPFQSNKQKLYWWRQMLRVRCVWCKKNTHPGLNGEQQSKWTITHDDYWGRNKDEMNTCSN